ncbi:piggyBac transposable element-derived protein 4-like [Labeo rohita]|uniref:piggyBac transposable element-derived protein 4-like n=1 Tax=Labeo rohita TaxID=84645 RepID=UPI0021E3124C|nr:piggyBac transposable element-derived protein 4-like [Labeo rohita]XP_050967074.1 piggyBac transposable element-derived protein 4-like [Labeo rohita]XP_050967083.1 piggyBac transposable element-derived protein 4-like [Labeo rohita]XP_050967091.1 piggyBac transposable element-derived protein 4-like [Labeo rohita]XP_050967097.1 piggyBac transposable element-derived protein 4-like [Labeo rohita]XP_050967102.1 piggyBac transposable element-derived protein 4-like [Labeo rohita]XP_050967111.1 pi
MDPDKSTENAVEDSTASPGEDLYICDQDSVASSVDSIAEEIFLNGLDPVLDRRPSLDIYTPEEDCDSEANLQQRKRCRLSSAFSRENENDGVSTERWRSSDETDVEPLQLEFTPVQVPGPKVLQNTCSSPLHFFQLLFPKIMMQSIVGHTNVYGTKCKDVIERWRYISLKDLKSYIGLVIYTGLLKCSLLTEYWRESRYFSPSFPAQVMSYQKFMTIGNTLHFSNTKEDEQNHSKKGTAAYERLGKILPPYQLIRKACKTYFHPFQNLTIDERIVTPQCRTGLKAMENKSSDRGYKLFALTDCSCGYTWDFFIHEGNSCASQNEGLSYESVMALVDENLLGSGYKLFVDKFYTSPTLFRDLLGKSIYACGPVLPTRKGFPKISVNRLSKNATRGTMRWIRDDDLLFVEWKDSQEVQMCSTFHKAYEGDTVQRKVKGDAHRTLVEVPIPAVVLDYNRNVGTVEPSNFITGHYRLLHKPKKWYQCVFYHLLDIAVENAFILHELVAETNKQKALTRKAFLEMLVLELTEMDAESESAPVSLAAPVSSSLSTPVPALSTTVSAPPTPPESSLPEGSHRPKHFVPDSTVGRRKCKLCPMKTPVMCVTCEVPLCFLPKRDCFNQWHESKVFES